MAETKLRKWRAKIVLQKFLYDEMAQKMFEAEIEKAISGEENGFTNLTAFHERINYIGEMKKNWKMYSENFWLNEKIIRAKIEHLVRRNKGKNLKMVKETLLAHRKEMGVVEMGEKDLLILGENGPKDTSLLRALSLCTSDSFAEYAEGFGGRKNLEELAVTGQLNVLICVAKSVKRGARRDETVAKLHFEKMRQLIRGGDELGDQFKSTMREHTKALCKLMEVNGTAKMKELLAEDDYFSAEESTALSSDGSAKSDETYEDANAEENFEQSPTKNGDEIAEENATAEEKNDWQNVNAKNKLPKDAKNITKNYYGRKEKKRANLEKKQLAGEKEEKSGNQEQTKVPKYLMKMAKNKEHKKKN